MSQQGLLATYLISVWVGRGVKLGSESLSGGGGVWKAVNFQIWGTEHHGIRIHKIPNITNLKVKIRVAQNGGKVWIGKNKSFLALGSLLLSTFGREIGMG